MPGKAQLGSHKVTREQLCANVNLLCHRSANDAELELRIHMDIDEAEDGKAKALRPVIKVKGTSLNENGMPFLQEGL